ncbi:CBF-domain-containing protein [Parathielavia appendiculata]|uniref:CBF-domain-containing protein n=1 Tax=Parathielavia appendiculata TaxID=2587402 RepID=A0AAN6U942_9PEZI|nr:CBF-domain-containing protein [Parathielavia appendiculata]
MGSKRAKERKKADKPSFDETALAQLTSKIDKSLAESEKQRPPKRKRQRDNEDEHNSKRHQTRPADNNPSKHAGEGLKNKHSATLLDEILALGGDENDLELVANVDSGDEGGDAARPNAPSQLEVDKSLRDELAQFASSLGFNKFHHKHEDLETEEEVDAAGDAEDSIADDDPETDEEDVAPPPAPQEARQGKQSGKLIFEPRPDWHGLSLEGLPPGVAGSGKQYSASVSNLKAYAEKLLEEDSSNYLAKQASSSTSKFISTIMSSGTLSDKVSALTLSIQESPLHNRKAFENLVNLAGKRSRGQAIAALGAIVDLLGNGTVLPADRRLRPFNAQPALLGALDEQQTVSWTEGRELPGKLTPPHLVMWAYEDWLKSAYFRIIQLLEIWCSDEIEYSRSRALDFVFGLLKSKPEQEANLLRLLVNKLGDRERKIASRASYLILQLLNIHPGMKAIVINAVEQEVLLKPGQNLRTKYTAINTLNQTILSMKEPGVADTLLRIYFDLFVSLLKTGALNDFEARDGDKRWGKPRKPSKKNGASAGLAPGNEQETAQKLVSSLLTGVNRAIPFATAEDSTLEKHLDTLFRITHSSNLNTSVQALMLIQQLAASKQLAVDRFYRTLYESLLDPRLVSSSKHALYLNLLFRAMKNDVDVRRVKAFVKRLIQILGLHQPSFTCGILFMIAELQERFPDLRTLLDEPEDNDDDGEEVYRDVREDGLDNLEAPSETNTPRAAAYDGRKRNPEHSNAHRSCLWELVPHLAHYHPSVCVFASNLLARQKALPKPDLASHTLIHFLDKFVYRNPKAEESKRGGSIMQPILASGAASHIVASSKASAKKQPAVNSASFWNLKPEQVSAEDVFFHEYFSRVGKPREAARVKKTADDQVGSEVEEAGEEEIWKALVNSQPEIEGADTDENDEMDLEEYDYSDNDMEVDGLNANRKISDVESDGSEGDDGFEGIFDDSEEQEEEDEDEDKEETVDEGEDEAEDEAGKGMVEKGLGGRLRRKELKSLPTFASADDYAEMLAGEDDLDD